MFEFPQLETRRVALQDNYGRYEIAPIDAGYSTSLANALRRVLLRSLPGAAVISIQIENVQHEFQDIPDVVEDVTDIVQKFKKLRLRCYSDHSVEMRLDYCGEGIVTARHITVPGSIEIVNPDLRIATLDNENARLKVVITAGPGKGFVSANDQVAQRGGEAPPIGVILTDSIFSPVCHVGFTIEPVPICVPVVSAWGNLIERAQKLDKIILDITTDGAISPDEALRQSAEIMLRQCLIFATYQPIPDIPKEYNPGASHVPIPSSIFNIPIEDIDLPVRSFNSMRRAGMCTVGQILERDGQNLLEFRNVGEKTLQDLYACFKKKGLFPMEGNS